jgi:hypothetical protein
MPRRHAPDELGNKLLGEQDIKISACRLVSGPISFIVPHVVLGGKREIERYAEKDKQDREQFKDANKL